VSGDTWTGVDEDPDDATNPNAGPFKMTVSTAGTNMSWSVSCGVRSVKTWFFSATPSSIVLVDDLSKSIELTFQKL
jgi:hypothetical protein